MSKKLHLPQTLKKAARNTFSKPATEQYPFQKPKLQEDFRGQPIFNFDLCISCGTCSRNCPAKAIEMVDVNGKKYPQFDMGKCVFCYQCVDTCPKKAVTKSDKFELATTNKSTLIVKPESDKES